MLSIVLSSAGALHACGGGTESPDAGGMDAFVPSGDGGPCTSDEDCGDDVFCNGAERCEEGSCVAAEQGACGELACDEATRECRTDCDVDGDADGFAAIACGGEDCDDTDPTAYPGATEIPADGIDQDCDGRELCFADADGDGFASLEDTVISDDLDCDDAGERGLSDPGGDCDDGDAGVNPDATEVVGDGIDQNCDGLELCYVDADGDGFRRDDATVGSEDLDCLDEGEADTLAPAGDCDDDDPLVNPFQPELPGDERDSNCDGAELCWADADGDGYRSADLTDTVVSDDTDCSDPGEAATSSPGGDCRDDDASIRPGRFEECNGVDDNCNGRVDEGTTATGGISPFPMQRRCGATNVGRCGYGTETCTGGAWGSCSGAINPHTVEICDGSDWDCDGAIDEGCGCTAGATRACGSSDTGACRRGTQTCSPVGEWGACVGAIEPAPEACNGVDDDCDGETDEQDAEGCVDYLLDADGDGYANFLRSPSCLCAPSGGYTIVDNRCPPGIGGSCLSASDGDCDDGAADVHPGAPERCDDVDHDCDGIAREPGAMGCVEYWIDIDNDTYGTGTSQCLCAPSGALRATRGGDCCDTDLRARPGATTWYSSRNACMHYDYNCNGTYDRRWEQGAGCHGTCNQEDYGWIGPWPSCGSTGAWLDWCQFLPVPPFCAFIPEFRTQMCR